MVSVRIEEQRAFEVTGRKIWIGSQDNDAFGAFWTESKQNGLIERLLSLAEDGVMEKSVFGVSRVEADPSNRAFYFLYRGGNWRLPRGSRALYGAGGAVGDFFKSRSATAVPH